MRITFDSVKEKGIERFEKEVLYWHVPTGTVCVVTDMVEWSSYVRGIGFKPDGSIVDRWHFVELSNYRKYNGTVKLSNK